MELGVLFAFITFILIVTIIVIGIFSAIINEFLKKKDDKLENSKIIELCDLSEIGKQKLCKNCKKSIKVNDLLICFSDLKPILYTKENIIYCENKVVVEYESE